MLKFQVINIFYKSHILLLIITNYNLYVMLDWSCTSHHLVVDEWRASW